MDLSIVIVSYNTKKLLDECLTSIYNSLKKSKLSFEVIVVDNVSTDGTRPLLEKSFKKVVTIYNSGNNGFGKANNQGIKKAKGQYILLINSDTVILDNAIEKLYEFTVKNPGCFVGAKLLNVDLTDQTSCGPFFTIPVVFAMLFLKGDVNGLTRYSPDETRVVDWVSGACIMGKKSMFMDSLLFDEDIFMYMEEVDLLMRAKNKGYKTIFYHESRIIHLGGGSSTNKRTGPVLQIFKGLMFVYKKHYGAFSLSVLRILLKAKAGISFVIGKITGSDYLISTYAAAYKMV